MNLLTSGWRPWWLDLRSLAASRMLLALCVLGDVSLRAPLAQEFYSDLGLVPRQVVIGNAATWSPFFVSGSVLWAWALFLLIGVLALGLLAGWRGRFCSLLLAVLTTGVHLRNPYVNNAGDVLLSLGLTWFALLPVSACWSLDRAGWRAAGGRALLSGRYAGPASLGLTFQVGLTYLFNHFYKTDPVWLNGQSVKQVLSRQLYSRDTVAALAVSVPAPLLDLLARSVWWLEFGAMFLLLVPSQLVRLLVVLALIGMHLGFAALLSIGLFPFVCIALLVALLPSGLWSGRTGGPYHYVAGSRSSYLLARVRRGLAGDDPAPVRPGDRTGRAAWWSALKRGPFLWPLLLPAVALQGISVVCGAAFRSARRSARLRWARLTLFRRAQRLIQVQGRARLLPGRRKWVLALVMTLGVPAFNLGDYWGLIPTRTSSLAFSVGIGQRWALFAPSPRYRDGYFVIFGYGDKGRKYDLYRRLVLHRPDLVPGKVVMGDALGAGFLGFRSEINRKFFEASVSRSEGWALRAAVRDALCRDARTAGLPVRLVGFKFMEFSGPDGRTVERDTAVLPCRSVAPVSNAKR